MVPVLKIDVSAETSDKVANFGLRVLEPFGLMSDIISNNLTAYKIKNLRSITQRTNELLKIQGCEPSEVSSKFLSKFIDEASVENDPVMQEMWANLLAGEVITSENTVYINILKDLTKEAAIILDEVYKKALKENYDPYEDFLKRTVQGGDLGYFSQGEDDAPSMLISAASLSDKGKNLQKLKIILTL